jgi:hypothetical protein
MLHRRFQFAVVAFVRPSWIHDAARDSRAVAQSIQFVVSDRAQKFIHGIILRVASFAGKTLRLRDGGEFRRAGARRTEYEREIFYRALVLQARSTLGSSGGFRHGVVIWRSACLRVTLGDCDRIKKPGFLPQKERVVFDLARLRFPACPGRRQVRQLWRVHFRHRALGMWRLSDGA